MVNNIHKLQEISQALVKAESTVALADSVTTGSLRQAAKLLFKKLDMSELEDEIGEPGFEQAGAILKQMEAAKAAFSNGETSAISVTTEDVDNDANGNDHTAVVFKFSTAEQSVLFLITLVQTRDNNEWNTELSYLDEPYKFFINGEKISDELSEYLLDLLEPVAKDIVDGKFHFTNHESALEVEKARALIVKYQPLLDMAADLSD